MGRIGADAYDAAVTEPHPNKPWLWWASIIGGAVLLWVASGELELLPQTLEVAHPPLLWVAAALHVPYSWLRAGRLRWVLDPRVRETEPTRRRFSQRALHGSGLLSFFWVFVLPLRLGELSRPTLLARAKQPGVGFAEALAGSALERAVDGLCVCGLLFGGLAVAPPPGVPAELLGFGRVMVGVFAVALIGVLVVGARPGWLDWVPSAFVRRAAAQLAGGVAAVTRLRYAAPFVLWSVAYWTVTVVQLWCVALACDLPLNFAEAAVVVAVIGLAIQLPGAPGQVGSFQAGAAGALKLFVAPGLLAGPGSVFAALMYLLQLIGTAAIAMIGTGLWLWRPKGPDERPAVRAEQA